MSELHPEFLDATCLDAEGTAHRIGDLIAQQPTVVVFVRHFG